MKPSTSTPSKDKSGVAASIPAPGVAAAAKSGAPAPVSSATAAKPKAAESGARLEWRQLLHWLAEDRVIDQDQVQRTEARFGTSQSAQHPLTRLGAAGLVRAGNGRALDTETLTEWLAGRLKLPYVRIDPLKVDVGRVADVMSASYAEARRCLPIQVGLNEVTIAVAEPNDTGWVPQIESHTRKRVKLALANPQEIARFTTEFFTLARSVRAATKSGESSQQASFEQLVELGRSNRQLDANDQGVV